MNLRLVWKEKVKCMLVIWGSLWAVRENKWDHLEVHVNHFKIKSTGTDQAYLLALIYQEDVLIETNPEVLWKENGRAKIYEQVEVK